MTNFNPDPDKFETPLTPGQAELDARLIRVLESAPSFTLSAGFAARTAALAANLPAPAAAPAQPRSFSTLAIQFTLAALIVAMLFFVPSVQLQSRATLPAAIEVLLALEFVALFTWSSLRPTR